MAVYRIFSWVLGVKVLAASFMAALLVLALAVTAYFGIVQAAIMWTQTYEGTEPDYAYSLVETSDGGYAIAGSTESFGADYSDFWLVKTDESGNELWNQTYGGTSYDSGRSLVETSDGGYAIAYQTSNFVTGIADVWLVKTDEFGVVPEASWVVLPLLVIVTLSIFINKKKLLHPRSKER